MDEDPCLQLTPSRGETLEDEDGRSSSPRYVPRSPSPEEGELLESPNQDCILHPPSAVQEYSTPSAPLPSPTRRKPAAPKKRVSRPKVPAKKTPSKRAKPVIRRIVYKEGSPERKPWGSDKRRPVELSCGLKLPYRTEVFRHHHLLGVLATDVNGYTLSNGVESWCYDNVTRWDEIAVRVQQMGVSDLYLVDADTERRWWSSGGWGDGQEGSRVRVASMAGSNLGNCHYCGDAECHRWKAVIGGIARIYKRSVDPIPHEAWYKVVERQSQIK